MSARSFTLNKRRQRNITVERDNTYIKVFLHGNLIVKHNVLDDEIFITDAGWKTNTTKTAINRYFNLINLNAGIYQSKFVWYLNLGQELVNLDDQGGSYSFYRGAKVVVASSLAKKVHDGNIIKEENSGVGRGHLQYGCGHRLNGAEYNS